MRRWALALLTTSSLLSGLFWPASAQAASPNKGLYISPLRSYLTLNAGEQVTRGFTVANLTDHPISATVSIQQFSVADSNYDYRFADPDNNWVQLVENQVTLQPNESHEVPYRVTIPASAGPGGHYYTLLAAADLEEGSLKTTVQAATLLYLTVNGNLQRTSELTSSSAPRFIFSSTIPYQLDVKNTGNVHYFAYFSTTIDGLFTHLAPNGASLLLMPGTTRHVTREAGSPFLPGIYRLTYGYTPDKGASVMRSQYIIFIPPWSILLLTALAILIYQFRRYKKKRS